jgi:flagellar biosynthetic protein FliO
VHCQRKFVPLLEAMVNKCHLKTTIKIVVLILLFISLSFVRVQSTSFADEKSTEWFVNNSPKNISSGKLEGYTRIVSTLLIVLALIIVTAFVLRKKYGLKTNLGKGKKCIQIIEHISLGVKKSLILVKVPGKHLLIGATNDKIGLISEIANEDVNDTGEIISDDSDSKGDGISNKEFLNLMKKSYLKHRQKQK